MKNLITKNFTEEIKQKENKVQLFHESKIQWEVPKFEEIEIEGGYFKSVEEFLFYRS